MATRPTPLQSQKKYLAQKLSNLEGELHQISSITQTLFKEVQQKGERWLQLKEIPQKDFSRACLFVESACICVANTGFMLQDWMCKNEEALQAPAVPKNYPSTIEEWLRKNEEYKNSSPSLLPDNISVCTSSIGSDLASPRPMSRGLHEPDNISVMTSSSASGHDVGFSRSSTPALDPDNISMMTESDRASLRGDLPKPILRRFGERLAKLEEQREVEAKYLFPGLDALVGKELRQQLQGYLTLHDQQAQGAQLSEEAMCPQKEVHAHYLEPAHLSLEHLPQNYRDPAIKAAILSTAKRVGRLRVSHVSSKRPDKFLDRDTPYPFSDRRGETVVRYGSGFVRLVRHVEGSCLCEKCKKISSQKRHKKYWRVVIATSTHHVFDQSESDNAQFSLDLDGNDVTWAGLKWDKTIEDPIRRDYATLSCFTHDSKVASKLQTLISENSKSLSSVQPGEEGDGLTAMFCHPHGSSKTHVVLGQPTDSMEEDISGTLCSQLRFICPTCPGLSSGWVWSMDCGYPFGESSSCVPHSGRDGEEEVTAWSG